MISKFLSVSQVSERLHVDPRVIRREIAGGRLEAVVVNRRGDYRISEESLNCWIAARRDHRHSA